MNLVTTGLNELPEGLTKGRSQRLNVQDDIQIFRGAEREPGLFHGQAGGRATDQDVLVEQLVLT